MMPEKWSDDSPDHPVLSAMLAYASYGYSVIPIMPGTKKPYGLILPEGKWRKYQQSIATPDEIERWIRLQPDTGVGVVCGSVSGGLACLDIDDVSFSAWIEANFARTLADMGAWVQRSGSGKLHVFVKTREPLYGTVVIGGGRKLADIRADGHPPHGPSYMVVAPTIHETSGEPYSLYAGDPEHVGVVSRAATLFDAMRDAYCGVAAGSLVIQPDAGVDAGDYRVMDGPSEEQAAQARAEVEREIRLSRKVRKALLHGAEAGEGDWATAPSNSEVDHAVIRELRLCGWDIERIERAFAWLPLGDHRYRSRKGTRGRGYIVASVSNIDAEEQKHQDAAKHAEGANFRVNKVVRVGFEEPSFELRISTLGTPAQVGIARLEIDDLMDEHRFAKAVGRALNFFPTVDRALEGRRFRKFGSLILQMAVDEPVPQSATVGGHLRATIMAFVIDETATEQPDDPRAVTLGWRNGSHAYVRGGALLQRLQNIVYPKPKPDDVWRTLRGMGAEEAGHKWPTGKTETLWALPLRPTRKDLG